MVQSLALQPSPEGVLHHNLYSHTTVDPEPYFPTPELTTHTRQRLDGAVADDKTALKGGISAPKSLILHAETLTPKF